MSNYDKVKEQIVNIIKYPFGLVSGDVERIISIPNLLIKADNQELPFNKYGQGTDTNAEIYKLAQQDMIKAGWVKVERR